MKKTEPCPKCQSSDIAKVPGENQSKIGVPVGPLGWAPVTRYICMQCGFTEQYVEGADNLQRIAKRYRNYS